MIRRKNISNTLHLILSWTIIFPSHVTLSPCFGGKNEWNKKKEKLSTRFFSGLVQRLKLKGLWDSFEAYRERSLHRLNYFEFFLLLKEKRILKTNSFEELSKTLRVTLHANTSHNKGNEFPFSKNRAFQVLFCNMKLMCCIMLCLVANGKRVGSCSNRLARPWGNNWLLMTLGGERAIKGNPPIEHLDMNFSLR